MEKMDKDKKERKRPINDFLLDPSGSFLNVTIFKKESTNKKNTS